MKKGLALMVRIIGFFLSFLGAITFCFLVILWSVEDYSNYSVQLWPMVFSIVIAVLGLICVKAGMSYTHS